MKSLGDTIAKVMYSDNGKLCVSSQIHVKVTYIILKTKLCNPLDWYKKMEPLEPNGKKDMEFNFSWNILGVKNGDKAACQTLMDAVQASSAVAKAAIYPHVTTYLDLHQTWGWDVLLDKDAFQKLMGGRCLKLSHYWISIVRWHPHMCFHWLDFLS